MRYKFAQTATEYLIILAVVIVISLIVVGVLGGIPSIGGGLSKTTNDAKLKTSKIAIISSSVTNEGTKVILRNNQAETVKVSALDINGTVCSSVDLPAIFPAGISKEILCTNIKSLIEEDVFEFPLIINYTDTKTNSNYVLDDDLKLIGQVGHKTVIIWAETIGSTAEINKLSSNGPPLEASDRFGYSIANIGDLDGDGVIDLLAGATGFSVGGGAYIVFLNSNGSVKSTVAINSSVTNGPNLESGDEYGGSVAGLGDLDGDGVVDIAIGADHDSGQGDNRGAVHIHFLNSDASIKSTIEINDTTINGPPINSYEWFGYSVANIGDLNEDGVVDIAVGAIYDGGSSRGLVHIIFLNLDGSVKSSTEINANTENGPILSASDFYGYSVANIGDLNGDGITDIAVGAYRDNGDDGSDSGAVHIHLLNTSGGVKLTSEINSSTVHGPVLDDSDYYGAAVAGLGDLNGDGFVDIVVGASRDDGGGANMGALHVHYLNSDGSIKSTVEINSSTIVGPSLDAGDYYGTSLASLGDLDGNGFVDFAAGLPYDNIGDVDAGTIYIHFLNSTLW